MTRRRKKSHSMTPEGLSESVTCACNQIVEAIPTVESILILGVDKNGAFAYNILLKDRDAPMAERVALAQAELAIQSLRQGGPIQSSLH